MKKNIKLGFLLLLMTTIVLGTGCSKNKERPRVAVSRTVLMYLGMDNSLVGYGAENVELIIKTATKTNIGDGKIIIFYDTKGQAPSLIEVTGGVGAGVSKILKTYPDKSTATGESIAMAIADMKRYAPANSYVFLLGSHGTGWMPANPPVPFSEEMSAMSNEFTDDDEVDLVVLEDAGVFLDQEDFATAMPDGLFDLIIFDECYGAGIEMAWLMRNKTKYVITSPAEVIAYGMPYDKIVPLMFRSNIPLGVGGIAQSYFDHYATKGSSATTAVWDCSQIEGIESIFKDIVMKATPAGVGNVNIDNIQHYNRSLGGRYNKIIFEIGDFINEVTVAGDPLRGMFVNKLNKIVLYKATTLNPFGLPVDPARYTGMNTYIPLLSYPNLNQVYKKTSWYKVAYPEGFIP